MFVHTYICMYVHTYIHIYIIYIYIFIYISLVNMFILLSPFVRGMRSPSIKALDQGVSCINMQDTPRHNGV